MMRLKMDDLIYKLRNDDRWVAFLKLVAASDDYYSLTSVVHNFIKIDSCRNRVQIEEFEFMHVEFETHIQTAIEISTSLDKIIAYPAEYVQIKPQGKVRPKKNKMIGDYPFYSMLTDSVSITDVVRESIWCEYAFVMMAAVHGYQIKVEEGEIKNPSKNLDIGMRGVRKLEYFKKDLSTELPLPHHYSELSEFIKACEHFNLTHQYDWLAEVIAMLHTFDENKEGYTRRYRSNIVRAKKIDETNLSDDDSTPELVTRINGILNDDTSKKISSHGMTSEEFASEEGIFDENPTKPNTVISNRLLYKRMSGKRNAIIHSSQRLFYKHNTLTPREAYIAVEALKPEALRKELIALFGIEALCLFGLLIFTGRSISNISTLRFMEKNEALKSVKQELIWQEGRNLLVIPTKIADKHNKLDDDTKTFISYACGTSISNRRECYEMNVPTFLVSLLSDYFKYWKKNYKRVRPTQNKARTIAFTNANLLNEKITKLLKHLNANFDTRLTERKVRRLFEQSFMKVSDDQAVYAYITGERLNHGLASAHYLYITPANLHKTHTQVMNQILLYATQVDYITPIQASLDLLESQNTYSVGSKLVLNSDLLKKYVKSIKQTVADAGRNRNLVHKHNHFVFYCIKLLAFATGYRAIGDPFDHISQLNRELGLMVISDKDFDDHFHTRIVPVSEIVLNQLNLYEQHIEKLKGQLGCYPVLISNLKLLLNRKKTKLPYFFFLSEKMRVVSVSPKNIKKHIRTPWNLPENVNRHYLRSEIVAMSQSNSKHKVSCECLDYFMGHWGTGEEPFNKHAMVSPMLIKEEIQPVLDHILRRDGWTPIKGPML